MKMTGLMRGYICGCGYKDCDKNIDLEPIIEARIKSNYISCGENIYILSPDCEYLDTFHTVFYNAKYVLVVLKKEIPSHPYLAIRYLLNEIENNVADGDDFDFKTIEKVVNQFGINFSEEYFRG